MTYFRNFGTRCISWERLKLEMSNLACRLATSPPKQKKCKIRSKGGREGSRDLLLKFWKPLYILMMVEDRNFKFGTQIGHWGPKLNNAKLGQKGS